jgi:LytR cell envelope-related transcriptional attenuator
MSFARVRALVVVGVLFVAAAIFVVLALVRDTQADPQPDAGCPQGSVVANVRLPERPEDVKVKVYNGTTQPGLAEKVGEDFGHRGFTVDKKKSDSPKAVDDVVVLRYGPKAVGAAWLIRAYFLNELTDSDIQYDPKRTNDVVDVIIGKKFQQLATPTEVKQALVEMGNPITPPGACPADAA